MMNATAIATLKKESPKSEPLLSNLLAQVLIDKGVDREVIGYLVRQSPQFLATVFGHLMMRSSYTCAHRDLLQQVFRNMSYRHTPLYQGTRQENADIDASIDAGRESSTGSMLRSVTWRGAAGAYESTGEQIVTSAHQQLGQATPIIIIGAGASGLLAARALVDLGFRNLLLLDRSGNHGGIWNLPPLVGASRANPFPLTFLGHRLEAAPGGSEAVMDWLSNIARVRTNVVPAQVVAVEPGDLAHHVMYEDQYGQRRRITAPIVINATGVGEPLPPSRPGVMTTDIAPEQAGTRWQEIWTPQQARRYQGQTIIFISHSNSTLEMVQQVQRYQREGLDIDYRILTHYPDVALAQPTRTIEHQGQKMRLYRDPSRAQLLRLAGDLPEVAAAFEQARDTGRIISHVTHWSIEQGEPPHLCVLREDGARGLFPYHRLYTLIGYGPRADTLQAMGLSVNHPYLGAVDLDYDGEVQREPGIVGRPRIYPGYFALGLRNAFNQNEVLLPGLLFRLPDLIASVIIRSIEFRLRH